jgi:hypothetical protein
MTRRPPYLPYLPQWAETRESDPIVSGAGGGRGNR